MGLALRAGLALGVRLRPEIGLHGSKNGLAAVPALQLRSLHYLLRVFVLRFARAYALREPTLCAREHFKGIITILLKFEQPQDEAAKGLVPPHVLTMHVPRRGNWLSPFPKKQRSGVEGTK